MDLKWKNIDELPMNEEMNKKVLLLSEGRISGSTTLHVVTDYWNVFFDKRDFDMNAIDKKERMENNLFSYGRFGDRKIPIFKIKGWMFADDLIELYYGKREQD